VELHNRLPFRSAARLDILLHLKQKIRMILLTQNQAFYRTSLIVQLHKAT